MRHLLLLVILLPGPANAECGSVRSEKALSERKAVVEPVSSCADERTCVQACTASDWAACDKAAELTDRRLGMVADVDFEPTLAGMRGWLERACIGGRMSSCHRLGSLHATGRGLKRDLAEARPLLAKACTAGVARACTELSLVLRRVDSKGARAALRSGCELGDWDACSSLASSLVRCEGRIANRRLYDAARARADALVQAACQAGVPAACARQVRYAEGKEEIARAALRLEALCTAGHGPACDSLGGLHDGLELPTGQDFARGAHLHRRACELGDASGCGMLAHRLSDGRGVAKDVALGQRFYRRGCALGEEVFCQFVRK
jgi:uncharacterized protein